MSRRAGRITPLGPPCETIGEPVGVRGVLKTAADRYDPHKSRSS